MKPNIFYHATKELSQDAFLAWLLEWADESNYQHNPALSDTAKDFVRYLIGVNHEIEINSVEVRRQWKDIDITATINNEYFIIIEDKTNSGERDKQLERYDKAGKKDAVENNLILRPIYIKTGNESREVKAKLNKEWTIIIRKELLAIMNKRPVADSIFNDFLEYMTVIETQTNSYNLLSNIKSDWRAAEGFYISLEDHLKNPGWGYVSNQSGGFLGLWYHEVTLGTHNIYIQIENNVNKDPDKNGIKVVVKISGGNRALQQLIDVLSTLQGIAAKEDIILEKPRKFRVGATSTLAIVKNAFPSEQEATFDVNEFISTLKKIENILNIYAEMNQTSGNVQEAQPL